MPPAKGDVKVPPTLAQAKIAVPDGKITLLLGPARSGKTGALVAAYRCRLAERQGQLGSPNSLWIAPTQSQVSAIRDSLMDAPPGAFLQPEVQTFASFAEGLILRSSRRIRAIDPLQKRRILEHLIEQLLAENQLTKYAAVARMPGFVRQVSETIAELKRRDVWAEDFKARCRDDRDCDVAAIYSAYQHFLHSQQLYDSEGRFWAAREELESAPAVRFGLVVVDGFTDFTAAQHDILGLLANRCEELVVSLLAARVENSEPDAGREFLFTRTSQTRDLLLRTAPGAELVAHEGSHFQAPGLVRLERELFRETPTSPELDTRATGLQIFAANGVQSEIREIARRVKRLLATGGAKSDDIAIVFRTLSEVAPRLAEIARDYGLDLLIDHRQRLSATPVARLVFDLLRLAIEDWPFELLLKVLGNKNLSEAIGGSPEVSALEQRHAEALLLRVHRDDRINTSSRQLR